MYKVAIIDYNYEYHITLAINNLDLDVEVLIFFNLPRNIIIKNLPILLRKIFTYDGKLENYNIKIQMPFGCILYEYDKTRIKNICHRSDKVLSPNVGIPYFVNYRTLEFRGLNNVWGKDKSFSLYTNKKIMEIKRGYNTMKLTYWTHF